MNVRSILSASLLIVGILSAHRASATLASFAALAPSNSQIASPQAKTASAPAIGSEGPQQHARFNHGTLRFEHQPGVPSNVGMAPVQPFNFNPGAYGFRGAQQKPVSSPGLSGHQGPAAPIPQQQQQQFGQQQQFVQQQQQFQYQQPALNVNPSFLY